MATPKQQANSQGWRPHIIRAAVIELLQSFFDSSVPKRDSVLSSYSWSEDDRVTDIKIQPSGNLELKGEGLEAKILVTIGPTQFQKILQGDQLSRSGKVTTRLFYSRTEISVQCVGESERFTSQLGSAVAYRFRELVKPIADYYDFKGFNVRGLSGVEMQDEDGNLWACSVNLQIDAQHANKLDASDLPAVIAQDFDL